MNLKELKNAVYELLGVTTTKEVKAKYPNRILTKPTEWQAILDELTAKSESDTEPTELYGFPESDTVLTGKTGALTEAFPTTSGESTGENSDRASADVIDDLEPDLTEAEPTDWAGIARTIQEYDRQIETAVSEVYNLVAVISPWAHYLQWLNRLYTNAFALIESTFWSYENA